MSDIDLLTATFFDLYSQGRVAADRIEDFIGAWHDSGNEEQRPLSEYLGMSREEYGLWLADDRTLPLLVAARCTGCSVHPLIAKHLAALKANACPEDASAIHVLSHWVAEHPAH